MLNKISKMLSDNYVRQTLSFVGVVFLAFVFYFGSYLPWNKSSSYISLMQNLGKVQNWDQLTKAVAVPLNTDWPSSPIGQEELVRNMGGTIMMRVVQANGNNPQLVASAVNMAEMYMSPFIKSERGLSFNQNSYMLGALNQMAFAATKDVRYLIRAEELYQKGLEKSPNRPQFLYGLFDVYRSMGNQPKAVEVADKIKSIWGSDSRLDEALKVMQQAIDAAKASSTGKTKSIPKKTSPTSPATPAVVPIGQ